jgi:GMP synthase-like glutamine amidotransferase
VKEGRYKLYIVGNDITYYRPWAFLFSLTRDMEEADVVLFTGGSDVSPELYGEQNAGFSGNDPERDEFEVREFKRAQKLDKKMIGICRGSQFLTVMNGGKLYQDVAGHALGGNIHPMTVKLLNEDRLTKVLPISSTHHQMMRPRGNFELLGWSDHLGKRFIERVEYVAPEMEVDPEIVFYPDTKGLAIQGHPEYLPNDCETNVYLRGLVKELLLA